MRLSSVQAREKYDNEVTPQAHIEMPLTFVLCLQTEFVVYCPNVVCMHLLFFPWWKNMHAEYHEYFGAFYTIFVRFHK